MKNKSTSWIQLLILAGGLVLAGRFSWSIWRIWKSGDKLQQAEVRLKSAQEQQQSLQQQLTWVQTPEFVEQEARNKLGYGREGEVIYVLPKAESESGKPSSKSVPVWKQWWDLYIKI